MDNICGYLKSGFIEKAEELLLIICVEIICLHIVAVNCIFVNSRRG